MHTVEGTWHTRQRCTKNTPLSGAYSALMLSVLNCQVFLRDSVQLTLNYMYWIVWSYLMLLIRSFGFHISFSANYDITLLLPKLFLTFFQNSYNNPNILFVPTPALLRNVLFNPPTVFHTTLPQYKNY